MSYQNPQTATNAILVQPVQAEFPPVVQAWMERAHVPVLRVSTEGEMMMIALRSRSRFVLIDGRADFETALQACRRLKKDSFTGIAPAVLLATGGHGERISGLEAMADEVILETDHPHEVTARLNSLLHRSERDTGVHPSTRLPGAPAIQREIEARMNLPFAVCYADLDHFKEFNDRYSYTEGDRVIRILATLLHDTVVGLCGEEGFVGHIGGDDFIFIVPRGRVEEICAEIVTTFDTLVAYQYSEHDRRAGYFFGKDRRGQLHRVPLMTLSIGVVTNERRTFANAKVVSDLATEMKTYAKTLPGSVYAIDRRTDDRTLPLPTPFTGVGSAR